jgi:toxin ParE1/3/4
VAFEVNWTEAALSELEDILEFIGRDSLHYTAVTEDTIHTTARNLARFPYRARIVPEFDNEEIREVFVFNYRLIFRIAGQKVSILMVVHSARLLDSEALEE